MTRKSILLTGIVVPLLVLSASAFAEKQAEERQQLLQKVRLLEINETGLSEPVVRVLVDSEIPVDEGKPALFSHGDGKSTLFYRGNGINATRYKEPTGSLVEMECKWRTTKQKKLDSKTTKTVRLDLNITYEWVVESEDCEFQLEKTSSLIIKDIELGKKERFPYGKSGNQFIELTISELTE